MEQIQNIEQLISEAMKISSKDERIKFVMNYFLNTVKFDYASMFAGGYVQGGITNAKQKARVKKSKLVKDGITKMVLFGEVEGESSIYRNILAL